MKSVTQTCVLWVSLRHLDSAAVYKCLQLPLEDYFFFIGYMSIDVPCILLKSNAYCKEDFLIPISKYWACYLTKKNHHLRFFLKENTRLLPTPSFMRPCAGHAPVRLSCTGGPKLTPGFRCDLPSATYRLSLPQTCCFGSGPAYQLLRTLGPLQHHLPFFCSLSHFSIRYHPYRSHSSMAVQRGKIRSSQHLYQVAPVSPLKTNSFWKHLQSDPLVSWRASLACTFGGTAK